LGRLEGGANKKQMLWSYARPANPANCGTDLCSGGNTQSENAAEWPPWSAVFF